MIAPVKPEIREITRKLAENIVGNPMEAIASLPWITGVTAAFIATTEADAWANLSAAEQDMRRAFGEALVKRKW